MKKDIVEKGLAILIISSLLVVAYILISHQIYYGFFWNEPANLSDIIDACENLSLDKTSRCLVGSVSTFYKYISHKNDSITVDDFKKNGGNCVSYANLYINMSKELGYNATRLHTTGVEDVIYGHLRAIIWDETDYCILDQTTYKCGEKTDTGVD